MDKEKWRNHWFFKKYEITPDLPFWEKVRRIQWNNKVFIFFECGLLCVVLNYFFR